MNPIKLSKKLQHTLVDYLTTTFDVNRDGKEPALAEFIKNSFNQPRALFAGPYLELTAPYQTGASIQQLVRQGILNRKLLHLPCFKEGRPLPIDAPLYTHQEQAIRKLSGEGRNVVVSSGTGSGKTESFLIPLLNDLVENPTPGVRAILIYPLNALVNDQLDRLRILLRGTEITFGRYTSELENKANNARRNMENEWKRMPPFQKMLFDQYPLPNEIIGRDQIREQSMLPQILITNYAMLEYLLLRPQDSPLFGSGLWKYVVLDEAHTYSGAQGIEVGLLMRRLKHRLRHEPGYMRCIATSATLTDDDAGDAKKFAEALFGELFSEDDIVFGDPDHNYIPLSEPRQPQPTIYLHRSFEALLTDVRQEKWESADEMALVMEEIGLITTDELSWAEGRKPPEFLYEVLKGNQDLAQLRQLMVDRGDPLEVESIAAQIFPSLSIEEQPVALYHLIELASMARPEPDKPSLLPARYHLFVRPPQGVWACLNPKCPAKHGVEAWSKLFASPRETCDVCEKPVYPVVVCRTCGQVYLRLFKVGKIYKAIEIEEEEPEKQYLTWRPIRENKGLADEPESDEDEEDEMMAQVGEPIMKQKEIVLCLECKQRVKGNGKCGCAKKSDQVVTLHAVMQERATKRGRKQGINLEIVNNLNECGRCHSKSLKSSEIATEISMSALTPLAILTEDLYRELPESTKDDIRRKPGNGRKLLSFYDSRQGAARFAAFTQDVVNQQAYRRLIREAVEQESTKTYWPALRKVCQTAAFRAIKQQIPHNDPTIFSNGSDRRRYSSDEEDQVFQYLAAQLLAEITTGLRSRQSLEALGLVAVQYFEPGREPDFAPLANQLGITEIAVRCLVEHLLDDLRRKKIISCPDYVSYNDPAFGRNSFEWFLVKGQTQRKSEHSWLGKTTRYRRRRLVQKLMRGAGQPCDDNQILDVLDIIFNWLTDKSDVLDTSNPATGYQLRYDRLFFQADVQWFRCNRCQRLNSRGDSLPCPHHNCDGHLQPANMKLLEEENFYYNNFRYSLIPLRVEEHTAQLAPQKGRDYQNKFKSGDINMLSCSTTFEMGIDLGDLQAVVMSNIPPTVANYKQRAGRAGRRTSGTAFIMAWASNRPHDQTYFWAPTEIISGRVRVPFLDVQNPIITQRHANAILLSEFLRFCQHERGDYDKTVGAFFDEQAVDKNYYSFFEQWFKHHQQALQNLMARFAQATEGSVDPHSTLYKFEQDLFHKGYERYQTNAGYYKKMRGELAKIHGELIQSNKPQKEIDTVQKQISHYGRLLERDNKEDLINYLSDHGVLPSYSFPLHTVELKIPPTKKTGWNLRLQRNLQQAIREYAPGQEIVADKRIWKSEGLDFLGKEPKWFAYHICPTCNYLRMEKTAGKPLEHLDQHCPVCLTPPQKGKWRQRHYIQPDGFRASEDSGEAAGQYVEQIFNVTKTALVPQPINTTPTKNPLISVGYSRQGSLLYVNEGFKESGFRLCLNCGQHIHTKSTSLCRRCKETVKRNDRYALGFRQPTDTLHLKFTSTPHVNLPDPEKKDFWASLKYALLQGASRALQIERGDIDGVLFPEGINNTKWQQTIVLYDNVPGGAGHVKRIEEEIQKVVAAALEIVDCDCQSSCYRCLREYGNQYEHHLLDRVPVQTFLKALDTAFQKIEQSEIPGLHAVVAASLTRWLWEQAEQAQSTLILNVQHLPLNSPVADGRSWLDLIQELLLRKVKVRLYLQKLMPNQPESVSYLTHLKLLIKKGLDLRQTNRQLPWTAIIDANAAASRAVKTNNGTVLNLENNDIELQFTTNNRAVAEISMQMKQHHGRIVEQTELREPADIKIIDVQNKPNGQSKEEEYFADFYSEPVQGMIVNDRYLYKKEKILNRLGAHIRLANQSRSLKWVKIQTRRAEKTQKRLEQAEAFKKLKEDFPHIRIKIVQEYDTPHDRFVEIERVNDTQARVIIGVGLDFIESDGSLRETFLIFQDPYVN